MEGIDAAINAWGVSDEQPVNLTVRRIRKTVQQGVKMPWPPRVEDLEGEEQTCSLLTIS